MSQITAFLGLGSQRIGTASGPGARSAPAVAQSRTPATRSGPMRLARRMRLSQKDFSGEVWRTRGAGPKAGRDVARTRCRRGHDGTATRPPLRTIPDRGCRVAMGRAPSLRHDPSRRPDRASPMPSAKQANPRPPPTARSPLCARGVRDLPVTRRRGAAGGEFNRGKLGEFQQFATNYGLICCARSAAEFTLVNARLGGSTTRCVSTMSVSACMLRSPAATSASIRSASRVR